MSDPYGPPPEKPDVDTSGHPDITRAEQYLNHDLKEEKAAKPIGPPDAMTSSKRPWSTGNYNFAVLVSGGEPRPPVPVGFTSDDVFIEYTDVTGNVEIQYKRNFEDKVWKRFKTISGSGEEVISVEGLNGVYRVATSANLGPDARIIIRAR